MGASASANAVIAAIDGKYLESLEMLLASGISPNIRLDIAKVILPGVEQDWSDTGIVHEFYEDKHEWYPLHHAAHITTRTAEHRRQRAAIITHLLDRGADVYALFRQPLDRRVQTSFPGDLVETTVTTTTQQEHREGRLRGGGDPDMRFSQRITYGIRSVLHSLLEDAACVQPILDHSNINLDLEHRDPQGRTLFHSACRNAIGADAVIDSVTADLRWNSETGTYIPNPFQASPKTPSLFDSFIMRGANILAVDYSGKNVLHHLLEAYDPSAAFIRPPEIDRSLRYVLENLPGLVHQPDNHGTYPLHVALQRLHRFTVHSSATRTTSLASTVNDILSAGADPTVRDNRGNTALHYLANSKLADPQHGQSFRQLFRSFLMHGVDIHVRNSSGRAALDLYFEDDGNHEGLWSSQSVERRQTRHALHIQAPEAEVLEMFDYAGVDWNQQDAQSRTLLHIIARYTTDRAVSRALYLLAKSVDPTVIDENGKTAFDIARDHENQAVLNLLETYNQA